MDQKPMYIPLSGPKPLRFIRLIPGEPTAPISVELVYAHLDRPTPPSYEAISYTWGDPTITENILLDNLVLSVTGNAASCLRGLRSRDCPRLLWMDAICINQKDIVERGSQVEFMHEIYAKATRVVVWLGQESVEEDSALAMSFLRGLDPTRYLNEYLEFQLITSSLNNKTHIWDVVQQEGEEKTRLLRALHELLHRPWLRRVWVQQEAAVCRNMIVHCGGEDTVTWDQFWSLAWLFMPDGEYRTRKRREKEIRFSRVALAVTAVFGIQVSRLCIGFVDVASLQERYGKGSHLPRTYTFRYFLRITWDCLATDPRDKIYAIMHLPSASVKDVSLLKVDYTIPWQILYSNVAKWICQAGGVDVIRKGGRSNQQGRDLPSWVPDWRHRNVGANTMVDHFWRSGGPSISLPLVVPMARSCNDPAGSPPTSPLLSSKPKVAPSPALEVVCVMQDRIVFSSGLLDEWVERWTASSLNHVQEILEYNTTSISFVKNHLHQKYITGEPAVQAYYTTLIAKTTDKLELASPDYVADSAAWGSWLECGATSEAPVYHKAMLESKVFHKMRFSVTARGYMCLVPKMSRPGDIVTIISGVDFPVVLRRAASDDAALKPYELLGDAYVHGMMEGEACRLIEKHHCEFRGEPEMTILENATSVLVDAEQDVEVDEADSKLDGYRSILATLGKRPVVLV